jgi:hypothetical protein
LQQPSYESRGGSPAIAGIAVVMAIIIMAAITLFIVFITHTIPSNVIVASFNIDLQLERRYSSSS